VVGFEEWRRLTGAPPFGRPMAAPLPPDDLPELDCSVLHEIEL